MATLLSDLIPIDSIHLIAPTAPSLRTVRRDRAAGRIDVVKVGSRAYVRRRELARYISSRGFRHKH